METTFSFLIVTVAIVKLFMMMALGYFLYRKKLIDDRFLDNIGMLLIRVLFPCLIIHKTILHFDYGSFEFWWMMPLEGAIVSLLGVFIALVVNRSLLHFGSEKEFICSSGFQNCGYLPIVLIQFALVGEMRDRLMIFVFLFIVGFNLLVWTFVPMFFSGDIKRSFRIKKLFTPPVVATVFSLLWVWLSGARPMPRLFMDPIGEIGRTSFPFSMICLGGYLGRYGLKISRERSSLATGVFLKLILVPAFMLLFFSVFPLGDDIRLFLFLQSIMPTAVSLVIIGSSTGMNNLFISNMIFYTHTFSMLTIPAWFAVYNLLFKS